ncbi:HAD-IIB family hydrolase [Pelagicoccus sp. SDUM812003]|uniref:HAD-IIB family hydrolase n=1 Tax=Pelagicoccus sp. SDUM812003 TaxID=3041267 RepID=UPI00280FF988|nr:HAD-IIB family hydrolase [Pelagicoccus sp. SDUM812003]MDQ8203156.1 HAD-IIB family hydrolase [Pelagicoccus sp. SDUM812003]
MNTQKIAIFTDLDGTLIDFDDYSSELTRPYVSELVARGNLIVFCSSKTFGEQRVLQRDLDIEMPCIVENGSAIIAPNGFWKPDLPGVTESGGWQRVELGIPSSEVRRRLARVESKFGESLRGFSTLMTEDVASLTGLDLSSARRAQDREYSETLSINLDENVWQSLDSLFEDEGLKCLPGGRFHTVIDLNADKGAAIRRFAELWKMQSDETLISFGLGDSENDQELLENVDWPHLVKRPNGSWAGLSGKRIERVNGVGPKGWVKVAKELIGPNDTVPTL